MIREVKKVVVSVMAIGILFGGVQLVNPTPIQAVQARSCFTVTDRRVNLSGDTNVRWQADGANAGSIFINATSRERGHTATAVSGFIWIRGTIGGPASAHNGWGGNIMWAVRDRFVVTNTGTQCN